MDTVKLYFTFLFKSFAFVVNLAGFSHAVPSDYCLENLNKSNCNVTPQSVFYYYKPGSRCEIGVWRGCPTLNKFDTEQECVNTCIFRNVYPRVEEKVKDNAECYKPINIKNCTGNYTVAFTYKKVLNKCVSIKWGGCPHKGNVFKEKLDCLKTCLGSNWNENVKEITIEQSEQVDKILDNFLHNSSGTEVSATKSEEEVTLKAKFITESYNNLNTDNESNRTTVINDETITENDNKTENNQVSNKLHNITTEVSKSMINVLINDVTTDKNVVENYTTNGVPENTVENETTNQNNLPKSTNEVKTRAATLVTLSTPTTIPTSTIEAQATKTISQSTPSTSISIPTTIPTPTGTAKEVILPHDIDEDYD